MKDFIAKIVRIQSELKAPKGRTNSFGGYKYRSCEDILEAVKPLCAKEGLILTLSDEPYMVGEWHYIKATATITDGEHSVTATASARESEDKKGMDASQLSGTSSSYARKYCLNGLLLIDDTKDADSDEFEKERREKEKRAPKDPTPQQKGKLITKAKELGLDINEILKQADWKEGTRLSMESFEKAEIILEEIERARREA